MHTVVRENLRTLYAAIEHGFAAPLPAFVRDELEAFVDCGVLARGFALLRCENPDCRERELVAFSCKGRGFCPSCLGRPVGRRSHQRRAFPTGKTRVRWFQEHVRHTSTT